MQKKQIQILVIVGCVILAGVFGFLLTSNGRMGVESLEGETVFVKCVSCGNTKELPAVEYYKEVQERTTVQNAQPMLPCDQCGKLSVALAFKCGNCGEIFIPDYDSDDFSDRCPECGYSKREELRKNN